MAFDQNTRNKLQNFVAEARGLLADEFTRQLQNEYGLDPINGTVSDLDRLSHLDDARLETARLLRDTMEHYRAASPSGGIKGALDRIVREQAFTVLNRLCALRMAEARGILIESIGQGYNSKGFQLYHRIAKTGLGETGDAYRCYLFSIFDELAVDLAVLFDRYSPMGRLFPREAVLLELLDKINTPDIAPLWAEDETIGWIYQYFNSVEERRQMRSESSAPRNSRELAVRNQFFTPRYVVEFLTDNTLGRIWYEMTKGETSLTESCQYLVRRPHEIFLAPGEDFPTEEDERDDLSQEELLQQPVYIPHRSIKDPRGILMLDPACGSMHFGLYAFDLYEQIYLEAWDWESQHGQEALLRPEGMKPLQDTYPEETAFRRDIPRLIIEHNIHGVDIDPRAAQIAGLSLWLRAQRSWKKQNIKPHDRPRVQKSNIVCAEPMPGEKDLLREFASSLKPRVLGQLVEIIFEKMELAGEAGSLLKIEEEIETAIEEAREEFGKELKRRRDGKQEVLFEEFRRPEQMGLFDFEDLSSKTRFWENAEQKILYSLQQYAERAEVIDSTRRRLFAQDAAKGFAFIDLCQKQFDAVLMNPPFGEFSDSSTSYLKSNYRNHSNNILCCFLSRLEDINQIGLGGCVLDRTILIKNSYESFRKEQLLLNGTLNKVINLGWGVLDANVEVGAIIKSGLKCDEVMGFDVSRNENKELDLKPENAKVVSLRHDEILTLPFSVINTAIPKYLTTSFQKYKTIADHGLCFFNGHTIKSDVFKRLTWEIPLEELRLGNIKRMWNGSNYSPLKVSFEECVIIKDYGGLLNHKTTILRSPEKHEIQGLCYGKRGDFLDVQMIPQGFIFTNEGFVGEVSNGDSIIYLSYLNSIVAQQSINYYCGQHKGVGYVNKLPMPSLNIEEKIIIKELVLDFLSRAQQVLSLIETDNFFISPLIAIDKEGDELIEFSSEKILRLHEKLSESLISMDRFWIEAFDVKGEDLKSLQKAIRKKPKNSFYYNLKNPTIRDVEKKLIFSLISYFVGVLFGRWDLKKFNSLSREKIPTNLFDQLPECPPGMLQNNKGLPINYDQIPNDYPISIPWDGILPIISSEQKDLSNGLRSIIEKTWRKSFEKIETKLHEVLGAKGIDEYFQDPSQFFEDHLKLYSKSRRQAPIYWMLSTPSGSYTLWLYYHRLSDQTLYICVNDFVEPELHETRQELSQLRQKGSRSGEEEKELERLIDFELELQDFRDELLRVAKFWKPNLNDGVQITASPLWKVTPHRAWRKKLKETWHKLEKGEYDWAHLAYSIWPERVIRTAQKDRSIAIAHDLEDALWEEVEVTDKRGKVKMEWRVKELRESDIKLILNEKKA